MKSLTCNFRWRCVLLRKLFDAMFAFCRLSWLFLIVSGCIRDWRLRSIKLSLILFTIRSTSRVLLSRRTLLPFVISEFESSSVKATLLHLLYLSLDLVCSSLYIWSLNRIWTLLLFAIRPLFSQLWYKRQWFYISFIFTINVLLILYFSQVSIKTSRLSITQSRNISDWNIRTSFFMRSFSWL